MLCLLIVWFVFTFLFTYTQKQGGSNREIFETQKITMVNNITKNGICQVRLWLWSYSFENNLKNRVTFIKLKNMENFVYT